MNQLIKDLGTRAGFTVIGDSVFGDRWYSSKCGMDASEIEKLVAVVVKECVNKCQTDWYGDSLDDILIKMKRHFGVE